MVSLFEQNQMELNALAITRTLQSEPILCASHEILSYWQVAQITLMPFEDVISSHMPRLQVNL